MLAAMFDETRTSAPPDVSVLLLFAAQKQQQQTIVTVPLPSTSSERRAPLDCVAMVTLLKISPGQSTKSRTRLGQRAVWNWASAGFKVDFSPLLAALSAAHDAKAALERQTGGGWVGFLTQLLPIRKF